MKNKKIWIAWEFQRRSTNLAKEFDAKLFQFDYNNALRYPISIIKTLIILIKERPKILFVQNPSAALAFLSCILKPFFNYYLIVDRHTLLNEVLKNKTLKFFDSYSLDHANLTIITNEYLKRALLENNKKRKIDVLPDKIPKIIAPKKIKLKGKHNAIFICAWAKDEPYKEVIEAVKLLPADIFVYVTGKPKVAKPNISNIVFTGFLPQKEFDSLLFSADVILDFTKQENCLICGGYEALALKKPLITSNIRALKQYFSNGTIYTNHNPQNIADSIKKAIEKKEKLSKEIKKLKKKRDKEWIEKFNKIKEKNNIN